MSRSPFGYVVGVDGTSVTLNLSDLHKGQTSAHRDGLSNVTEIGSLFGINSGGRLLVLKVQSLKFTEPREAHQSRFNATNSEPLRNLVAIVLGTLSSLNGNLKFGPDSTTSPGLGSEAFPLSANESSAVLNLDSDGGMNFSIGYSSRLGDELQVNASDFFGRHLAVLGSSGQGKSCFVASILQSISKFKKRRVVIFDINGEYEEALRPHTDEKNGLKVTRFGGENPTRKIPYYALGRNGLGRLLLPSEKTQRPALNFALENLSYVEWGTASLGASLAGERPSCLFDDCRTGDATAAYDAIEKLRTKTVTRKATNWPNMRAMACLIAESYSLKKNRNGAAERDAFFTRMYRP